MKRIGKTVMSLVLACTLMIAFVGSVYADSAFVYLNGAGPVSSDWLMPREDGDIKLEVNTQNEYQVRYDVFDKEGNSVINGTLQQRGTIERNIKKIRGKYYIRLQCQERRWHKDKCEAQAKLSDRDRYVQVDLRGEGPVQSEWLWTRGMDLKLEINNYKKFNIGFDVYDRNGNKVDSGILQDKGNIERSIKDTGSEYRVSLYCNEDGWKKDKCEAQARMTHDRNRP